MNLDFLDFEQPIAELEDKINSLQTMGDHSECKFSLDVDDEIRRLQQKSIELTEKIFSNLDSWQITKLARHPHRPYTVDYMGYIFTDFDQLSGDRIYGEDEAIVGGLARLDGRPVMVIGHQKGRTTNEKIQRNFGMPSPEGYRKALRLMQMAEQFRVPLITLIDTPGAYPGIGAEERNQAGAIAQNLLALSQIATPVICTIIGEGGSGGALAMAAGDRVNMLQYSIFSVISPEGCAAILWKNPDKAHQAAEAMGITADRLKKLRLIDSVIQEPLGGAHRDPAMMAERLKNQLLLDLSALDKLDEKVLLEKRYKRLMQYGNHGV